MVHTSYREHAAECIRRAHQAPNEDVKAMLLKMAEMWIRLAEYVETLSSAPKAGIKDES